MLDIKFLNTKVKAIEKTLAELPTDVTYIEEYKGHLNRLKKAYEREITKWQG